MLQHGRALVARLLGSGETHSSLVMFAKILAERFNALPPSAVRETKRLMRAPQRAQVLQVMQAEGELFAQRLRSPEAMEAFQAFFQKRKPDFSKF